MRVISQARNTNRYNAIKMTSPGGRGWKFRCGFAWQVEVSPKPADKEPEPELTKQAKACSKTRTKSNNNLYRSSNRGSKARSSKNYNKKKNECRRINKWQRKKHKSMDGQKDAEQRRQAGLGPHRYVVYWSSKRSLVAKNALAHVECCNKLCGKAIKLLFSNTSVRVRVCVWHKLRCALDMQICKVSAIINDAAYWTPKQKFKKNSNDNKTRT